MTTETHITLSKALEDQKLKVFNLRLVIRDMTSRLEIEAKILGRLEHLAEVERLQRQLQKAEE